MPIVNRNDVGKVSVVMPAYNAERYIAESILSVMTQSYPNWELIVVDDCSSDGTLQLAKLYAQAETRIKVITTERNCGPAIARNKAIEVATGQYIAFLDSDDIWHPDKLDIQIRRMQNEKAFFSFTGYEVLAADVSVVRIVEPPTTITYEDLLYGSRIGCLTVIYDVSVLGKKYFPDIKSVISKSLFLAYLDKLGHEDYALWLNILKNCREFGDKGVIGIPTNLAGYRTHQASFSAQKKKAALYQWIIYREVEKLGLIKSMYYFSHYAWNALRKRLFQSPTERVSR